MIRIYTFTDVQGSTSHAVETSGGIREVSFDWDGSGKWEAWAPDEIGGFAWLEESGLTEGRAIDWLLREAA